MVDSLRSGGFSFPGLGYGSRTGGFSQYRIGNDDAENLAYLDKLSAQTAWQNGQISDDAYLQALRDYVDALDKDSSSYISAVNQLEDATWNIGRNKLVIAVNDAATPNRRIAALKRLQAYDRRWRSTMVRDNEQYREMTERIEDIGEQIRAARWAAMVERYNANKVSDARMMAFARSLERASRGRKDEATYRAYARQFEDSILDDRIQDAIDAWEQAERPSAKLAGRVEQLYRERMGRMNPASAAYERYAEALASFQRNVAARKDQFEFVRMQSDHEAGRIGDDEWLGYLHRRVQRAKPGTTERIQARDAFLNESFRLARTRLERQVANGSRDVSDLIDFHQSSLVVMDLDSSRAQSVLAEIERLRAQGFEGLDERLDISGSATTPRALGRGGGHWVLPSGVGTQDGYISQHDGSQFAKTNCGMASAAMLAWDVTGGKTRVTGGELRYYSGDRAGGTWTDDVVRALGVVGLGAREYHGMSLSTFRRRLARGLPAVLQGTNAMLPAGMRFGYDGDHSVFVSRMKVHNGQTFYWVMDPNGPGGGYTGAWWTEDQIFAFGWQGSYQGSVVFAGKSGQARSVLDPDDLPPIQRFDTDYMGRSTLGRGGGASRSEAGPRRDWSKGKKLWKMQKAAGGPEAVADFLSVVDTLESRMGPEERQATEGSALPETEDARLRRASRILARNDNDPRLAMVEWFTGETPTRDPAEWTQAERWFANAAARRLELEPIKREPIVPEPGEGEGGPPEPLGQDDVLRERAPLETGLDPELDAVAQGILRRLGVEPTPTNTKLIASWVAAESGQTVEGNNPLNLLTPGDEDLPGQYGRNSENMALFDSLEDGIDAAVAEIAARMPELAGALRGNDPGAVMVMLADSGWSDDPGYGRTITQVYNQLPGDAPLITRAGADPLEMPWSIARTAFFYPQVGEMFDVDPTDDIQMGWFSDNLERAREAAERGERTFMFLPPGATAFDGALQVPISQQAAKDLLRLDFDYAVETLPPNTDRPRLIQEKLERLNAMSADVDLEAFRRYYDTMTRDHGLALMRGDWTMAYNIELDIARATNAALGIGPDEDPSIDKANRDLSDEDHEFLVNAIERLQPRSTDPNRPGEYAPNGSPLLQMERRGELHADYLTAGGRGPGLYGATGYAAQVTMDPGAMFVSMRPDGTVEAYTRDNAPAMFKEVRVLDPNTGEPIVIPAYQSPEHSDLLPVCTADGLSYQEVKRLDVPFVELLVLDLSGASRDLEAQRQSAGSSSGELLRGAADLSVGLGPMRDFYQELVVPPGGGGQDTFPQPSAAPDEHEGLLKALTVGHDPSNASHPTIWQLELWDSEAQDRVTWLSLDQQTWIGWVGDKYGAQPPGLVAMNGATWRTSGDDPFASPELVVFGQPFDPAVHGSPAQYLGWRGAPGTPGGEREGIGAPNAQYMLRQASLAPSADGTAVGMLSVDLSLTPMEHARFGAISYAEAAQRTLALMSPRGATADQLAIERRAAMDLQQALDPAMRPWAQTQRHIEMLARLPGGTELNAATHETTAEARASAARATAEAEQQRAAALAARAEAKAAQQARQAQLATTATVAAPRTTTTTPAPTRAEEPPIPKVRQPTPAPRSKQEEPTPKTQQLEPYPSRNRPGLV